MNSIHFDPERHVYTVDGVERPSVTQALSVVTDDLYRRIDPAVLEHAQRRGTYVHRACELHVLGTLDESTVDLELLPFLEGFRKFMADTGFTPIAVERRVFHRSHGYAGTVDLVGILDGNAGIVDIKTPAQISTLAVGAQLAAYKAAWNSMYPDSQVTHRWALRIRDAGFKLDRFTDAGDLGRFMSALGVYQFKGLMK